MDLDPVGICDRRAQRHEREALAHGRRGHHQGHADLRTKDEPMKRLAALLLKLLKGKCISHLIYGLQMLLHTLRVYGSINRVPLEKEQ